MCCPGQQLLSQSCARHSAVGIRAAVPARPCTHGSALPRSAKLYWAPHFWLLRQPGRCWLWPAPAQRPCRLCAPGGTIAKLSLAEERAFHQWRGRPAQAGGDHASKRLASHVCSAHGEESPATTTSTGALLSALQRGRVNLGGAHRAVLGHLSSEGTPRCQSLLCLMAAGWYSPVLSSECSAPGRTGPSIPRSCQSRCS